jgi:DNA-binding MarR family transcriptional regulator
VGLLARRLRQSASDGDDLSLSESSALARLERGGPSTASALAQREQIRPQSMGAIVGSLEARGYVERRPDPADGRQMVVSITKAGVRTLRSRRNQRTERLASVLAAEFSAEEVEQLERAIPLLERLAQSI